MRSVWPRRFARPAGVVGAVVSAAMTTMGVGIAVAAPPDQPDVDGAVKVELGPTKRDCEFSPVDGTRTSTAAATATARHGEGPGFALIDSAGGKLTAQINLTDAAPSLAYAVRLNQLPSATCTLGSPGVAVATLQTDPEGNGSVTLEADVMPGATGAWVVVLDESGQVYTSNTVAPVGACT